jgi:hypothetical protein
VNKYSIAVLLLMAGLGGCSTTPTQDWTASRHDETVVWADDDSEWAIIVSSYEQRGGGAFRQPERRNFNHQLVIQNGAEGERIAVTSPRDDRPGQIFYMKSAGYFLLEAVLSDGSQQFSRILPNGNEILVLEGRPTQCTAEQPNVKMPHSIIPSPNGRQLAHIYTPQCGELGVEFMHASTLNFIDGRFMSIEQPLIATWHPQGYLILSDAKKTQAWKIVPGEDFTPISPPDCLTPSTSSSDISSTGLQVSIIKDKLVTQQLPMDRAFGCQSHLPALMQSEKE